MALLGRLLATALGSTAGSTTGLAQQLLACSRVARPASLHALPLACGAGVPAGAPAFSTASTSTEAAAAADPTSAAATAATDEAQAGVGAAPLGADTASGSSSAAGGSGLEAAGGGGGGGGALPPSPLPEPKPELVDQFLSTEVLKTNDRRRVQRQAVTRDFQRHPADTGSPQVMVALWTQRMRELVPHFDTHRKQLGPMRHLEMMANQRRRMLIWLRRADFPSYAYTVNKLGLRDVYTPTGAADRYREGLRASDPVTDDAVNRRRFNYLSKYRQKKTSLWERLRPSLAAEDPLLVARDAAAAVAAKQRRQRQRTAAAAQHL